MTGGGCCCCDDFDSGCDDDDRCCDGRRYDCDDDAGESAAELSPTLEEDAGATMAVLDFLLLLALLFSSAVSLLSVPVLSNLSGRAAEVSFAAAALAGAAVKVAAVASSVIASSSAPFPFLCCSQLKQDDALSVRATSCSFPVLFSDLPSSFASNRTFTKSRAPSLLVPFASLSFFEVSSSSKHGLEVTVDGLTLPFSTRDVN